jgi:GH15 family glucan-1,4-alpha-glucosidase
VLLPDRAGPRGRTHRLSAPAADHALIGDGRSAALVTRAGAIDWLCWPRFDSPACLAALLGTEAHGVWDLSPAGPFEASRAYRGETMVLETRVRTAGGDAAVIDQMVPGGRGPWLLRIVEGRGGEVAFRSVLRLRAGYGRPREIRSAAWGLDAGGMAFHAPLPPEGTDPAVIRFAVTAGRRLVFALGPAAEQPPAAGEVAACEAAWRSWAAASPLRHPLARRSLLVLKALIHAPTGAVVAAPTTSLPEVPGGCRNWDYRFCWLRDSAFVLEALLDAGLDAEARAWLPWLRRVLDGPSRVLADLDGNPPPAEHVADWLPGHDGARPVRIGNAAADQAQLDVFGEVGSLLARLGGCDDLLARLAGEAARAWRRPDQGIWEMRAEPRHFVFSKLMAWVALDRAGHPDAPTLRAQLLREGYHTGRNSFVQAYGGTALDASLLLLPRAGLLPPDDPRVRGTIDAVAADLTRDGLVARYRAPDGLPGREGAFLPCSFWLADALALTGRRDEAEALFERLCRLANDVGLYAEEYDPDSAAQLGNFPQALTHAALVRAAATIEAARR